MGDDIKAQGVVFHRDSAVLANNENSVSPVFACGSTTTGQRAGVYGVVRGFVQADQNGRLEIYQAFQLSDISTLPAVGSVGNMLRIPATFTSGGNGLAFSEQIVAPFVRVRFNNNSGAAQTAFRFHVEAVE